MQSLVLRAAVVIVLVVAVPTAYILLTWKIASVYPTVGRMMGTLIFMVVYGFIATVAASVFLGSHVGVILFAPLCLASIPKAWKDAKLF